MMELIPKFPADFPLPILVVQHMPDGFTEALANRLDTFSPLPVKEAAEGDVIQPGHVYIAKAGKHMQVRKKAGGHVLTLTEEEYREGVRPCANYTYESLAGSDYDEVLCAVLTGMGADGTEGIKNLKKSKKVRIWIQDKESCVVFGMPGSIVKHNLECNVASLSGIAIEIIKYTGGQ